MAKKDAIEMTGKVVELLPDSLYRVELSSGQRVVAHLSGNLRMDFVRLSIGDVVHAEMSPYDLKTVRITSKSLENPKTKLP